MNLKNVSDNNDTILNSGKHKHNEGGSWMLFRTIMYGMELRKKQTYTMMIIDHVLNIKDMIFIFGTHKQ